MGFRSAVEGIIVFGEKPEKYGGWLAVLEDVATLSHEEYERLRRAAKPSIPVWLEPAGITFNKSMATYFFNATRQWVDRPEVTVIELINMMPYGVVSKKARKVAVWRPIERALTNVTARVTATDKYLLADIDGTTGRHVTCIDLEEKLFACTCPAYGDGTAKRHVLCKHLMHSIYRHSEEILSYAGASGEWIESLKSCQKHHHAHVLVCNWLYYFIKHVFADLSFQSARLLNPEEVREAFFNL